MNIVNITCNICNKSECEHLTISKRKCSKCPNYLPRKDKCKHNYYPSGFKDGKSFNCTERKKKNKGKINEWL